MEFNFDINQLLQDEISIVDEHSLPSTIRNRYDPSDMHLYEIIDKMGIASAKAQGLRSPITSGHRLLHSGHNLYIMKSVDGNRSFGSVLGILKMGHKHLFVFDKNGIQQETNPLCVLDFYVHESRQRTGCGKRLFQYMLQHENIKPQHLAIDRPSHKFQSFLGKHYKLKATIPQVNNFVVYEGFFRDRQDTKSKRTNTSVAKNERENVALSHVAVERLKSRDTVLSNQSNGNSRPNSALGMMAQNNSYSRHVDQGNTNSGSKNANMPVNNIRHACLASNVKAEEDGTSSKTEDVDDLSLKIKDMGSNMARGQNPPLLNRELTSDSKKSTKAATKVADPKSTKQPWVNPYADPSGNDSPARNLGSGWNIFGVPSPSYHKSVSRIQTTNLW